MRHFSSGSPSHNLSRGRGIISTAKEFWSLGLQLACPTVNLSDFADILKLSYQLKEFAGDVLRTVLCVEKREQQNLLVVLCWHLLSHQQNLEPSIP